VAIDLIAEARSNFMKIVSIINPQINTKMQVVGIPEETTVLGVSSIALRDNAEISEAVTIRMNELIGTACGGADRRAS
jgi:hypothetical protein